MHKSDCAKLARTVSSGGRGWGVLIDWKKYIFPVLCITLTTESAPHDAQAMLYHNIILQNGTCTNGMRPVHLKTHSSQSVPVELCCTVLVDLIMIALELSRKCLCTDSERTTQHPAVCIYLKLLCISLVFVRTRTSSAQHPVNRIFFPVTAMLRVVLYACVILPCKAAVRASGAEEA